MADRGEDVTRFFSGLGMRQPIQYPTREIHVRLLDEGTECSRPTPAESLGQGLFKLLRTKNYEANDEKWEFPPGTIVRARVVQSGSTAYLLATSREDL